MKNKYYWDFGYRKDGPVVTVENSKEILTFFKRHSEISIAKAITLVADLSAGRISPKVVKCLIT